MTKRHSTRIRIFMHPLVLSLAVMLTVLLSAGPNGLAAASSPYAQVSEVGGQAFSINEAGERTLLTVGVKLTGGDMVDCRADASATLTLNDGSTVKVSEGSRVALNRLLPQEKTKFSLSLFFGRLALKIKRLRGDDMVLTPTMVAGVRGTEFTVSVADDGASVLSVAQGRVGVVTEKEGTTRQQVQLDAGQEVQVDETGAILIARPVKLETLEEWKAFRRQRLERMKDNLPRIVQNLESDVDTNLENLKKLEAQPLDRAKVLATLAERLAALPSGRRAERAQIIIKTHMELARVDSLVQQFRLRKMRIQSAFVRSEHLKTTILPMIAEPAGTDYRAMDRGLSKLLQRKEAVQTEMTLIGQKFDQGLGPVNDFIKRLKESENTK